MGWSRRKRTAWAAGLSAVLHVLMLTGMVVGLKVATPPPEPEAIELSLIRPPPRLVKPPPPEPVLQTPRAGAPPRPRLAPQPPAGVPTVALPPAPPAPPPRVYGPGLAEGGVKPSLSGRVGCDEDPLARRELTETQRQACANNLTARAKAAPPLPINIPDAKLAQYDRNRACHEAYAKQGIPRSGEASNGGSIAGLGNSPSLKDCGPGDR